MKHFVRLFERKPDVDQRVSRWFLFFLRLPFRQTARNAARLPTMTSREMLRHSRPIDFFCFRVREDLRSFFDTFNTKSFLMSYSISSAQLKVVVYLYVPRQFHHFPIQVGRLYLLCTYIPTRVAAGIVVTPNHETSHCDQFL